MKFKVISFYKYVLITNPPFLRQELRTLCLQNHLLGRILLSQEGINGAVSGERNDIESFKETIKKNPLFANLTFREQFSPVKTYHKLVVKARDEIVKFGTPVDMTQMGKHLSPQQLKEWYDADKDFVIIDARNDYEYAVGKFKNAVTLPIHTFREFPAMKEKLESLKEKNIVLYCTGGIRCEKASAYLKQNGFSHVHQLQGGIINYINQYPNTYWQGGLFVFDDRLVSEQEEPFTNCMFCHIPSEHYYNCYNLDCDKLFIACNNCSKALNKSCSEQCENASRRRVERKNLTQLGIIENYYTKKGIALLKVQQLLQKGNMVVIQGKTTNPFSQTISMLKDEKGDDINSAEQGMLVTIPIQEKVRRNDKIFRGE